VQLLEEMMWAIHKEMASKSDQAPALDNEVFQQRKKAWIKKKRAESAKFAWSPYGKFSRKRNLENLELFESERKAEPSAQG